MGKRLSPEEREARKTLRETKELLQKQLETYKNVSEFSTKDALAAIQHAYSILARYEKEYEEVPTDEYYREWLEKIDASSSFGDEEVTIEKKVYDKLIKSLERERARSQRIVILRDMSKANRVLAQQVSENEKINELQKRSKYIEVTTHASVLAAFLDITYLALRRIGLSEPDILEFSHQLDHLKRDYPAVNQSMEDIIERLTGGPTPKAIEAESRVVEETPLSKMEEIEELL